MGFFFIWVWLDKGLEIFGDCDGLKLFRGDLSEEGSFDEAVKGCVCVFHVAASMEFGVTAAENIGDWYKSYLFYF